METTKISTTEISVKQDGKLYTRKQLRARKEFLKAQIDLYISMLPEQQELNEIKAILLECDKLNIEEEII